LKSAGLTLLLTAGIAAAELPSYPRLGPPWKPRTTPAWQQKGVVFVGSWEPLPWLYRKNWQSWNNALSGAAAEKMYREERSDQTVAALEKLGVNMFLTGFHKGFGIERERATMEDARALGVLLHKHSMKMGVYVSGLLLYEELYEEFPQARNWHRMLVNGQPDIYGDDGYRYRAFLNHPEYLNYMKRVCELAVKAGADLIHFDVISQPYTNTHPIAETMFRDWLQARYPQPEQWFFRSGLQLTRHVKIPAYADPTRFDAFDQPVMQEYLRFASQLVGYYAAEMSTFIHGLNPETAIEFNPQGITGANRVLGSAIDHAAILPWLDSYWSEEPNHASYTADGRLISKIRSYKVGEQYQSQMFAYTGAVLPNAERATSGRIDPRLTLAEAMAFNRQCLGDVGDPLACKQYPEAGRRYIRFFHDRFDLFEKTRSAAEVAVLRGFASMAYNNYTSHQQVGLAEQALIQSQVPFDIIEDHNLADLSRYRVLLVAHQESLSDEDLAAVRRFVSAGGGVVTTEGTAVYDQWRRLRPGDPRELLKGDRVVWLPRLAPRIAIPPHTNFTNRYWAPPGNSAQLLDAIYKAAAGQTSLRITAPPSVAANVYYQPERKRYLVHLIDYNGPNQPGARVRIEARWKGRMTLHSPDLAAPIDIAAAAQAIELPPLNVYSILVIQQ